MKKLRKAKKMINKWHDGAFRYKKGDRVNFLKINKHHEYEQGECQ